MCVHAPDLHLGGLTWSWPSAKSHPTHTLHVSSPTLHTCWDMPSMLPPCFPDRGREGDREKEGLAVCVCELCASLRLAACTQWHSAGKSTEAFVKIRIGGN